MGVKFKIGFSNMKEYVSALEELSDNAEEHCKRAVYDGAHIVADELKKQIKSLPTAPEFIHGSDAKQIRGASKEQIDGLIESMGLAPIQYYGGTLNTKVGFDGYNSIKTKKYPGGQPNMMIARSINSGSSFRKKIPFVEHTAQAAQGQAEVAMALSLQGAIDSIVAKGG